MKFEMPSKFPKFAVATATKPILNVPHFKDAFGGSSGSIVDLANKIELCALKGTKFRILEQAGDNVFKVQTTDYPGDPLYVDGNSLEFHDREPEDRAKKELPMEEILKKLWDFEGKVIQYIWGANCTQGIPEMLKHYPPSGELDDLTSALWKLHGTDCSGLLYEVTEGYTPRNTSDLVTFGDSLPIENKSAEEIAKIVQKLDLIVWKGHVVIVLNSEKTIESRGGKGIIITDLIERLKEAMETRRPANKWTKDLDPESFFVVQRWHSSMRLAMSADHPV
jgi:hypothetical protein